MDANPRDEPERCCFDDWVDHWAVNARKRPTAAKLTERLLDALDAAGLRDRTVLDLGCGIGDLAIGTLARGATTARGYDLSPKAIDEARRLASERGVASRSAFEIGDAAKLELPQADVVVLNRVFCCYPDATGLLERSLAAAGSVYAYTIPRSTGLIAPWIRVWNVAWNVVYRVRRSKYAGFRTYIHDVEQVDATVRARGFRPVRREVRRVVWDVAVYAKAA